MRRTSVLFRQRTCLAAAGVPRSTTGSTQKVPVQFRKEKFHPYFPRFLQEESVCTHSRPDRRDGYRSHVRKQCIESVPENGSKSGESAIRRKERSVWSRGISGELPISLLLFLFSPCFSCGRDSSISASRYEEDRETAEENGDNPDQEISKRFSPCPNSFQNPFAFISRQSRYSFVRPEILLRNERILDFRFRNWNKQYNGTMAFTHVSGGESVYQASDRKAPRSFLSSVGVFPRRWRNVLFR